MLLNNNYPYCELSSNSKVCQFSLTLCIQEDIACFDVSVDLPHEVKILQTLQSRLQDGGYLLLCKLHTHTDLIFLSRHLHNTRSRILIN